MNAAPNHLVIPEVPYRDTDYFFRKKHFFGAQKRLDHKVSAVFPDRAAFDRAVAALQAAGVRNDEIHTAVVRHGTALEASHRIMSLAPFFVPIGLLAGSLLGALVGIAVRFGYLTFFGIEPFHYSLWQSLQANSVVGGFTLGILALVFGLRLPEFQPSKFETDLPDGTLVIMVRATEEAEAARVRDTLQRSVRHTRFPEVNERLAA